MFLNFLQTVEEKVAFMQMAIIVAIANVEEEETKEEKRTKEDNGDWKMSSLEEAIINGFMKELEPSSHEVSTDVFTDVFDEVIDELSPVLSKITRLSEEERRLEIIEKLIEDGISWDEIEDISPKSARSMMVELLSVALVDEDYAPLEKIVIESIANKLKIDGDELEEMEDFVNSMKKVYKTGLEIINN